LVTPTTDKIPTGVEVLDTYLEGGLPRGSLVLLEGDVGSLRNAFAYSVVSKAVQVGLRSTVITVFKDTEYVKGQIKIVSRTTPTINLLTIEPIGFALSSSEKLTAIVKKIREACTRANSILIDSLTELSVLLNDSELVTLMAQLALEVKKGPMILLLLDPAVLQPRAKAVIEELADCVLKFEAKVHENRVDHTLFIQKIRGVLLRTQLIPIALTHYGVVVETVERIA